MKKIENRELKINILNKTYYNNYLLKLEQTDKKHFEEILNDYLVLETSDNLYIILNISKPSINKILWFDDEQPIPEKTEELFIKENMMLNGSKFTRYNEDIKNAYLYNPYNGTNNNLTTVACSYKADKMSNLTFIRDLTADEKIFIKSIIDILIDEYIERLKRYYKRYNKNIHCLGYWVNR